MGDTATKILSADEIKKQIKPLSNNGFLAFFQKIGRGWLTAWYSFSDKHPKLSKIIYMLFFFVLFSQAVTVFQALLFIFLPSAFGMELAKTQWFFPDGIKLGEIVHKAGTLDGVAYGQWTEEFYFFILGKPVARNAAGVVQMGGGLGYFFAFLIATFLAQCINFPLQRNITFRSHGNPWYQAMWYFIGWIFIQPFCDMIGSLWKYLVWGVLGAGMPVFLSTILDTIIMGGVAMAIFFFVFLIIFPDYNAVERRARKKLDKVKARGEDGLIIEKAEEAVKVAAMKAKLSNAEKAQAKATTKANAKAIAYFAAVKNAEKVKGTPEAKAAEDKIVLRQKEASEAVSAKDAAIAAFKAVAAESKAPKAA